LKGEPVLLANAWMLIARGTVIIKIFAAETAMIIEILTTTVAGFRSATSRLQQHDDYDKKIPELTYFTMI
jgi:hypothetical protein